MNILAWLVLGAIAGYIAGLLVRGDEGLGVIGHIILGIEMRSLVVAVIGAVIVVVVIGALTGRRRTGGGPI
jgi:uncharacterized membrane protein YeaQ/YmgE (transglycosylase-associated protein family)